MIKKDIHCGNKYTFFYSFAEDVSIEWVETAAQTG